MSIVGTRPPTLDEWNKYELHHRARLAIKPGILSRYMCCFLCSEKFHGLPKLDQLFHQHNDSRFDWIYIGIYSRF